MTSKTTAKLKKKPNHVWVVEYFDSVDWRPMLRVFCLKKSAKYEAEENVLCPTRVVKYVAVR